jgi:hypothetical protein
MHVAKAVPWSDGTSKIRVNRLLPQDSPQKKKGKYITPCNDVTAHTSKRFFIIYKGSLIQILWLVGKMKGKKRTLTDTMGLFNK